MLLTAGCSFVWGDELDGYNTEPPSHWHLTFTHLLAEKLAMPYENMGMCGSSNHRIFRDVIDHLHDPTKENPTHMVIIWSAWQRSEIVEEMAVERENDIGIRRSLDHTQFSPQRVEVLNKGRRKRHLMDYYNGLYDSKTDIGHGITKMKSMEVICDAMGIQLVQGVFHGRCWQNILKILQNQPSTRGSDDALRSEYVPEFAHWLKNSIKSLKDTSRVGLGKSLSLFSIGYRLDDLKPYQHPGEKSQVVFADFLYEQFQLMEQPNK